MGVSTAERLDGSEEPDFHILKAIIEGYQGSYPALLIYPSVEDSELLEVVEASSMRRSDAGPLEAEDRDTCTEIARRYGGTEEELETMQKKAAAAIEGAGHPVGLLKETVHLDAYASPEELESHFSTLG